jgi:hypothetical protein
MPTVEQEIKQQFARLFVSDDAGLFKNMADYYLRHAAFLQTSDVNVAQYLRLLARNCQKRLFIGIGTELLPKAIYLQSGFSINKLEDGQPGAPAFPFTFDRIAPFTQVQDRTYTLDQLIDKLHLIPSLGSLRGIARGLKIAKVFRNKEGHSVLPTHSFDPSNHRDVENALVALYRRVFGQALDIQFSVAHGEEPRWRVTRDTFTGNDAC